MFNAFHEIDIKKGIHFLSFSFINLLHNNPIQFYVKK